MVGFSFVELLIIGLAAAFGASMVAVLVYVVLHACGGARRRE